MSKIHQYLSTDRPCKARKNKKITQPQLPEEDRPSGWKWIGITYKQIDTFDAKTYKCLYCPFITSTSGKYSTKGKNYTSPGSSMHDHCVTHFPPTIHCLDCGDNFHLQTSYNDHFDDHNSKEIVMCEYCGSPVQKKGLKTHYKKAKKCIKARKKKGIVTEYDTDERERAAPEPTAKPKPKRRRKKFKKFILRRKIKVSPCEMV